MGRTFFAAVIVGGLVLSSVCFGYSGGSGTLEDPYLISTADDMNQIGRNYQDWDKYFKLTADIDLSAYTGTQFSRIGTDYQHAFNGVFDGDGHTISNFTYASSGDYIGIFGNVGNAGIIENVSLIDVNVTGNNYVGGLVGHNEGTISNSSVAGTVSGSYMVGGLVGHSERGSISYCYSTGSVAGEGSLYLGGLVGYNYNYYSISISNCYSTSNVTGGDYSRYIGGLVGSSQGWDSTISYCYSTGNVRGGYNSDYVGGLAGEIRDYANVTDCYATGEVGGDYDVGGLVGMSSNQSIITRCYSSGNVSGYMYIGGLLGWNDGGTTTDSFWDVNTSGQSWSVGGIGKTTAEMKMGSTFADAGWDLWNVWFIKEGITYPQLRWSMTRYSGGTGTPDNPYRIATADDLNDIGNHWEDLDKYFVLVNDIDLSAYTGTQFNIIGKSGSSFWGTFDGDGHTISNFTYIAENENYIGVFGRVVGGEVNNVSLVDVNVTGHAYVGGLVGYNTGTIINCHVAGNIAGGDYSYNIGGIAGYSGESLLLNYGPIYCSSTVNIACGNYSHYIGGLIGRNDAGYVRECYSAGVVTGGDYSYDIGGLIGLNGWYGFVGYCYSTDDVTGGHSSGYLGGLVGENVDNSYVGDCYATGEVNGDYDIGGLVGMSDQSSITRCYSLGHVSGEMDIGGLLGWNYSGDIIDSFWDVNTSGQSWSAGGEGKTTTEMMTESTFTDAGWDFDYDWSICEGTNYPRLWWQIPQADWVCPDGINIEDLDYFVQRWLLDDCASSNNCDGADMNGSGKVDFADFAIFAQNWLKGKGFDN